MKTANTTPISVTVDEFEALMRRGQVIPGERDKTDAYVTRTTVTLIDGTKLDLSRGSVLFTGRGGTGKSVNLQRIAEAVAATSHTTLVRMGWHAAGYGALASLTAEIERRENAGVGLDSAFEPSPEFPLILVVADDFGEGYTPAAHQKMQDLIIRALANQNLGILVAAAESDSRFRQPSMPSSVWSAFDQLVRLDLNQPNFNRIMRGGAIQPSPREILSN